VAGDRRRRVSRCEAGWLDVAVSFYVVPVDRGDGYAPGLTRDRIAVVETN
jgi:hypothetical protein